MSHLSLTEAANQFSGDDTEDTNDEPNGDDIGDMSIRCGALFYLISLWLVVVRLSVVLGRFFEATGDNDGCVTL